MANPDTRFWGVLRAFNQKQISVYKYLLVLKIGFRQNNFSIQSRQPYKIYKLVM